MHAIMVVKIIIADYDPQWPIYFAREKARLHGALGDRVVDIQHIGSTAVPGLAAKPVIDIIVGVASLAEADRDCVAPIVDLGYEYVKAYEKELPFRRYFRRHSPDGMPTYHIHMLEVDSDWWRSHLAFRGRLRTDPAARTAYENLKRRLAQHDWPSGMDYARAKGEFIEALMKKVSPINAS